MLTTVRSQLYDLLQSVVRRGVSMRFVLLGEQHALEYVGARIEVPIEDLASEPEMQRRFSHTFRMLFVARYLFLRSLVGSRRRGPDIS